MSDVKINLNEKGRGSFTYTDGNEQVGEMAISVSPGHLIVDHTDVSDKAKGKGVGKALLGAMVAYARANNLKVTPVCPYVHAQFSRHPEAYADIWDKSVRIKK